MVSNNKQEALNNSFWVVGLQALLEPFLAKIYQQKN
jgi:hypothetical protein